MKAVDKLRSNRSVANLPPKPQRKIPPARPARPSRTTTSKKTSFNLDDPFGVQQEVLDQEVQEEERDEKMTPLSILTKGATIASKPPKPERPARPTRSPTSSSSSSSPSSSSSSSSSLQQEKKKKKAPPPRPSRPDVTTLTSSLTSSKPIRPPRPARPTRSPQDVKAEYVAYELLINPNTRPAGCNSQELHRYLSPNEFQIIFGCEIEEFEKLAKWKQKKKKMEKNLF